MTEQPKTFEPGRHLSLVNGNEYLEVKWRLVWLRSEVPDAAIDTELVSHAAGEAIFKATVTAIRDGKVCGSATGWGSEDAQSFGDYIEKAETKAIGRALAALGFGTQFSYDHADGASGRIADSPVRRTGGGASADLPATERQLNLINAIAREMKLSGKALDELSRDQTGQSFEEISRKSASALIEVMKERQGNPRSSGNGASAALTPIKRSDDGDGKALYFRKKILALAEPRGWTMADLDEVAGTDYKVAFADLNADQASGMWTDIETLANDGTGGLDDLLRGIRGEVS